MPSDSVEGSHGLDVHRKEGPVYSHDIELPYRERSSQFVIRGNL